ncbi:hypothetical protein NDU88_006687 [Pleurodeles waltl]|uniref:Uncharacterized protein n=1 Tax=Pleurodeles waltl TaxID=8319 RepID=A0AAV7VRP9_PLEWA|nr:hypothetical protein NDU88_006687 [Pleurodeles waltl]
MGPRRLSHTTLQDVGVFPSPKGAVVHSLGGPSRRMGGPQSLLRSRPPGPECPRGPKSGLVSWTRVHQIVQLLPGVGVARPVHLPLSLCLAGATAPPFIGPGARSLEGAHRSLASGSGPQFTPLSRSWFRPSSASLSACLNRSGRGLTPPDKDLRHPSAVHLAPGTRSTGQAVVAQVNPGGTQLLLAALFKFGTSPPRWHPGESSRPRGCPSPWSRTLLRTVPGRRRVMALPGL